MVLKNLKLQHFDWLLPAVTESSQWKGHNLRLCSYTGTFVPLVKRVPVFQVWLHAVCSVNYSCTTNNHINLFTTIDRNTKPYTKHARLCFSIKERFRHWHFRCRLIIGLGHTIDAWDAALTRYQWQHTSVTRALNKTHRTCLSWKQTN